jgi:hypothetical protein
VNGNNAHCEHIYAKECKEVELLDSAAESQHNIYIQYQWMKLHIPKGCSITDPLMIDINVSSTALTTG